MKEDVAIDNPEMQSMMTKHHEQLPPATGKPEGTGAVLDTFNP